MWLNFIGFLAVCLFYAGILVIITLVINKLSGLARLSKKYAYRSTFLGKTHPMCSAWINGYFFKGTFTIGLNQTGLYLKLFAPFRLGLDPIFIPWQAIKNIKAEKAWYAKYYLLEIGHPKMETIKFSAKLLDSKPEILQQIRQYSER